MKEVLDRIESELTTALRRSHAARRRRRSLTSIAAAGLVVLLTAGAGLAAVSGMPTPIDRLLGSGAEYAQRPGTARLDVTLTDPGGLAWTASTYLAKNGTVSSTSVPRGLHDRLPSTEGESGFVLADNLLDGPVVGASLNVVRANSHAHYLFSGTVDARARTVVVELAGERRNALLSASSLSVAVERPPARTLTAEGKRRAARMPRHVSVRAYAVAFTPDLLSGKRFVRAVVETTLADGTSSTQSGGVFCVSRRCGARFPNAG